MTPLVAGPVVVASLLVLMAGAAKVVRPHNTTVAFEAVTGRGVTDALVRGGAATEVAVAVLALVGVRLAIVALGVSYLAFALFVAAALRRGKPVSSCGCFGEADVPPTRIHIVVDLAAAVAALVAAAADESPSLVGALRSQPLAGVPFLLLCAVATGAAYVVLAELPKLRAVAAP